MRKQRHTHTHHNNLTQASVIRRQTHTIPHDTQSFTVDRLLRSSVLALARARTHTSKSFLCRCCSSVRCFFLGPDICERCSKVAHPMRWEDFLHLLLFSLHLLHLCQGFCKEISSGAVLGDYHIKPKPWWNLSDPVTNKKKQWKNTYIRRGWAGVFFFLFNRRQHHK